MPVHVPQRTLSLAQARRVALAAQGFADRPPAGEVTVRQLRRLYERIKVLQIDSVNVLCRAHYLPAFSRLGPYDRALLDSMAWPRRDVFEYWAHMASFSPVSHHPLLRWRMHSGTAFYSGRMAQLLLDDPRVLDEALAQIRDVGPVTASEFAPARPGKERGAMWGWHDGKVILEHLFMAGEIACLRRNTQFERVFDLPERVLPASILAGPTPSEADAKRALIELAAQAHGIATARDLRDYFRIRGPVTGEAIDQLVQEGVLVPVSVRSLPGVWYLHRDARMPRSVPARALLAPFDPLVWERNRTEDLWDFHYRIEIYTPKHKRVHGYYVLPFLLDEQIAARVDLKADRAGSALLVQSAHLEPATTIEPGRVAEEMMAELQSMAQWLGLGGVAVRDVGTLASLLAA